MTQWQFIVDAICDTPCSSKVHAYLSLLFLASSVHLAYLLLLAHTSLGTSGIRVDSKVVWE